MLFFFIFSVVALEIPSPPASPSMESPATKNVSVSESNMFNQNAIVNASVPGGSDSAPFSKKIFILGFVFVLVVIMIVLLVIFMKSRRKTLEAGNEAKVEVQ